MKSLSSRTPTLGVLTAIVAVLTVVGCQDSSLRDGPLGGLGAAAEPVEACPGFEVSGFLGKLYINEIMLRNTATLADESGAFVPWLEIYNASGETIELGGVTLSDSLSDTTKWSIPCVDGASIEAGGYFIVYLDGDEEELDDFHASFTPPTTGVITFVLNGGSDLVEIDADLVADDVSYGRAPDGGAFFGELLQPSPNGSNCPSLPCSVEPVELEFLRGDVNDDGVVDAADVDALFIFVFEDPAVPDCADRLDVNDDGYIDLADAHSLALAIEGEGTIPAPFPDPGGDPTSDDPFLCELTLPEPQPEGGP